MNQLNIQSVIERCSAARIGDRRPGEAAPAPRALGNRAFSLLEVMLAVVILGLGILGISAVFAGAAKQQQTSSEIQRAVAIGLNAKATLTRKLGRIDGDPSQIMSDLPDGQWGWVRSIAPTVEGSILDVSSLSPSAFFLANASGGVVYEYTDVDLMNNPINSNVLNASSYDESGSGPPFQGAIADFARRNITPSSLTIRISVSQTGGIAGAPATFDFFSTSPPPPDEDVTPMITLYRNGVPGSDTIEVQLVPSVQGRNAYIERFNLSSLVAPDKWISFIEVLPYEWKSTDLLSLNERLFYVDDERFPPAGQRPEGGFVLFFRRLGEISQAMVLTYSLQPQSRPRLNDDQFPLITPEHFDPTDQRALVREVDAELHWDDIRQQYYLRVSDDPDDAWIVQPGQRLLMKHANLTNGPGSDNVIRVINQLPDESAGSFLRGYLDDAPRVNLTAVVPQDASQMETITLFVLNPEIENADSQDDTRWKVRPVDARLVPIVLR